MQNLRYVALLWLVTSCGSAKQFPYMADAGTICTDTCGKLYSEHEMGYNINATVALDSHLINLNTGL